MKKLSVVCFLVLACSTSFAQLPPWTRFTLDNGLEVLVCENHLTPIVTIEIAVKNGSFTETPDINGLSHLYEHMFFTANKRDTSEDDFLDRVDKLGIVYNGETHEENVQYYFTLPKQNLEKGLDFMAVAITSPLFKQTELDNQIAVVNGEFDRNEANPYFSFTRALSQKLWGDLWNRKEPLGVRPAINAATREKMLAIQKKYYIPNNSLLIVAGDVNTSEIKKLVPKYFSSWQEGPDPFKKDPSPVIPPLEKTSYVTDFVDQPTAAVAIRWHGPSIGIDDKSTYAADVFSEIIRQAEHEFTKSLMESGVATSSNFWYYTQRLAGPIQADIATTPDKLQDALRVFWQQFDKFTDPHYFTDEELETSKAQLRSRILYDSESLSEFSKTIAFWWASTGLDYYEGYLDNLAKVNRKDIKAYIDKYLTNKPYILGLAIDQNSMSRLHLEPSMLGHGAVNPK
ncbi:MAG: pitrilysin family protein [Bacteroidota bacterium]|nr:pitrilysin family protein [Bacteroidota bacterium]MDP4229997.1 pitrilysin family protein [Bacteroidota bacterium]MDP4235224.1 pitrilysin family protein [Bacteroidota bacterium]